MKLKIQVNKDRKYYERYPFDTSLSSTFCYSAYSMVLIRNPLKTAKHKMSFTNLGNVNVFYQ